MSSRLRRWFAYRFLTRVEYGRLYHPDIGPILTTEEWEAAGGWSRLRPGYHVERPDWWARGQTSGVTAATVEEATAKLNDWQDDMARRDPKGMKAKDPPKRASQTERG